MISKFAASDDLKISQVEVISECEGLLNLSMLMRLTTSRAMVRLMCRETLISLQASQKAEYR